MIKIAIIGFGAVGQGVAEILLRRKEELEKKIGKFSLVAVTDSRGSIVDENGIDIIKAIERKKKGRFDGKSTMEVIEGVDFDVMIECSVTNIDDGEPGLTHIMKCLEKGAHIITSNKGPLVADFHGINRLAEKKGLKFMFEATVGGAMPLIKLVKYNLAGNSIEFIKGVLNGTCNYILTRMEQEKMTYQQVLAEAQELNIAEANPDYDVKGFDSAAKLLILANALMGMDVKLSDVEIVGITDITPEAFDVAKSKNYTIRLIAEVNKKGYIGVTPRLVPIEHPLAIHGTMNAALIKTDLAGDVVVMGRGAGKYETASAIISDLIFAFS
ncbi:homoserine dehydrogenase [Archaeoglobus sulfaticallidus PM70-1]|uniref:Homoserine dehydrogenase n=1 Tax=Archaeoglobus sulfaticallidus PM70-1 TaxID=387631 RepID=N0BH65_9EURY|nr:homoserine dehydrogenase [Archaeoglobus sulfaticallidus]AGK61637.1 homoserine dehydrogenase [Archaeoglobus sulfaticallidus PM70-1]